MALELKKGILQAAQGICCLTEWQWFHDGHRVHSRVAPARLSQPYLSNHGGAVQSSGKKVSSIVEDFTLLTG